MASSEETDLMLTKFRNRQFAEFRLERGQSGNGIGIFFEGQITAQDHHWQPRPVENSKLETPNYFTEEVPDDLTTVQRLFDGVSEGQTFPLPHDWGKWEPSDKLIQFQWPEGAGKLPSVVYLNDDNINANDITIVVTTDESAWVLMLPERLVLFIVDQFNLHTNTPSLNLRGEEWYRENIGNKVQDLWEEVIRPADDTPGLRGELAGIFVLSRADEHNKFAWLQNRKLIETILADMWAVSDDPSAATKGPLQGQNPITIPWFMFRPETRLGPNPEKATFVERLMAPQHYFVVESRSQSELRGGGSRRKESSLLRLFYGGQVVLSGKVSRELSGNDLVEDGKLHLSSPEGRGFGSFPFQPPSPCD